MIKIKNLFISVLFLLILLSVPVLSGVSAAESTEKRLFFYDVDVMIIGRARTTYSTIPWAFLPLYIGPQSVAGVTVGTTFLERINVYVRGHGSFTGLRDASAGVLDATGIFFRSQLLPMGVGLPPIIFICCHARVCEIVQGA